MLHRIVRRIMFMLAMSCLFPALLPAQDTAELLTRMKAMEERIRTLEAEVQALKARPPETAPTAPAVVGQAASATPTLPTPPAAAVPEPEAGPSPAYGGAGAAAAKIFNPDISLIGDFRGAAGNGASRPTPALEMHETELGLQAIIDPYARADVFLTFGEHGVDLEEGYITFTALPGGLQLKAGKMRAAFGRVNGLHNHVLPWTDRPLVTENLVGGEEGISDAGLSLSRILPAPKQIFLEATGQVFRGDSEGVFHSYHRSDVAAVGHLRAYRDITESTNIDLGGSYARGHSPLFASSINQLFGMDATVRWKPLRRSIYRSFVGRSELVWGRAQQAAFTNESFGYYVSGDYQLGRRWFIGGRFDRSTRLNEPNLLDTGGSVVLTYWPSEFSQIRGQLRRTEYGGSVGTANEFLIQLLFSMGAHGAHPF